MGRRSVSGREMPLPLYMCTHPTSPPCQVVEILQRGEERKRYAATAMNERSSRAHTVFLLQLALRHPTSGTMTHSQLHMVDLAGCEQVGRGGRRGAAEGSLRLPAYP